jgi:hypothetical protein
MEQPIQAAEQRAPARQRDARVDHVRGQLRGGLLEAEGRDWNRNREVHESLRDLGCGRPSATPATLGPVPQQKAEEGLQCLCTSTTATTADVK